MMNSTKQISKSLPKGKKIHQESQSWNSITVLPDQMGLSVLKALSLFIDGMLGLIELSRCAVCDVIDCDANWFSVSYVERDRVKPLYVAKSTWKRHQSVNRVWGGK